MNSIREVLSSIHPLEYKTILCSVEQFKELNNRLSYNINSYNTICIPVDSLHKDQFIVMDSYKMSKVDIYKINTIIKECNAKHTSVIKQELEKYINNL